MDDAAWNEEVAALEYALAVDFTALPDEWPTPETPLAGVTPFGRRSHGRFLAAAALAAAARQGVYGIPARRHEEKALALSRAAFMRGVQARLEESGKGATKDAAWRAYRYADRLRQWYYRAERAYKVRKGWVKPPE